MLPFFVVIPILISVILFITSGNKTARVFAIIIQSALFAASVYLAIQTREAALEVLVGGYDSVLGIALRADSSSAVFIMLTTIIFLMISIYTFDDTREKPTFWFLLFVLEATLIGLFLTGDLFNIFIMIEVSTLAIVVLTMYDRNKRNMFYGKLYLLVNIVAIQFFIIGLAYVYRLAGAMDMERVRIMIQAIDPDNLTLPYALIMTSIAFKCALIPFFSWTPKAYLYPGAPTAVAAILSGLQIKAAIYLFIRVQDIFASIAANEFFLIAGIIVGVFGVLMAFSQTDIKLLLAYSTVSQVGLIIIALSTGSHFSYIGGMYHIVSHAILKTALFMSAGIITKLYGTTDIDKIRGVMRFYPVISAATLIALLGIAGAPFLNGSISKYFISYDMPFWLNASTIIISLGTIITYIKFGAIFFGGSRETTYPPPLYRRWKQMNRPPVSGTIPVLVLCAICLVGGLFGPQTIFLLFGYDAPITTLSYLSKTAIFAVSVGAGFLIYKYIVNNNIVLKKLGDVNFSFQTVCASMGVFFAVLLVCV